MRHPIRRSGGAPRRGIAMIAVLIVVAILALAAYRFSDLMLAEQQAADSYGRGTQARAAAISGVHYAAAQLAQSGSKNQNGTVPNFFYNPALFQAVLVQDGDTPRQRARFSIVSPVDPDTAAAGGLNQSFLYGVTDETGKLNINALLKLDSSGNILYNVLMQLPNMTDAIANSIVFWVDPKATQRASGATDEYYGSLDPPYHAKNAPLDQIEELLFVQGVTPQLLFGNDRNRNGILDPDEDEGAGALDMGWSAYLTVYSRELNVDSQGNPRIYINDPDLTSLQTYMTNAGFDDTVTTFVIAARMYGLTAANNGSDSGNGGGSNGSGGNGSSGGGGSPMGQQVSSTTVTQNGVTSVAITLGGGSSSQGAGGGATMAARGSLTRGTLGNVQPGGGGSQNISSLYALINATVTIPGSNGQPGTTYPSPLSDTGSIKQYLPMILDKLTTKKGGSIPARVNVNTAPSTVLAALAPNGTPLLDVSTLQLILGSRPSYSTGDTPDPIFQTPAWLITEANVPVSKMQSLEQYITARSQVFRVQSLGHFDSGGPVARVEAVIDTNAGRPRIIYFRDLTSLGKGFNLPAPQQ
jgi:type II secretory pathway component PulK